ncbi:hypothetical protein [Streptomyces sp. CMB-StM0423]|uniref:hypothetical protein n=1 Tax=Streptomyces sp. CMB-StM0423 TaxID=2059884 RepID=UPI000C705F0E|nr:hypothetical protein [Streptomyces sp. CMB-StM0423]AUH40826.1 hypothetical protein CXR04_11675 [Streptomyces sp. CMB-StM0423]
MGAGDSGAARPWVIVREDDNGNHYRVGRYATRDEAERVVSRFSPADERQIYRVERAGPSDANPV